LPASARAASRSSRRVRTCRAGIPGSGERSSWRNSVSYEPCLWTCPAYLFTLSRGGQAPTTGVLHSHSRQLYRWWTRILSALARNLIEVHF
jgi:hypothetical protein